jgi:hypothetical protein
MESGQRSGDLFSRAFSASFANGNMEKVRTIRHPSKAAGAAETMSPSDEPPDADHASAAGFSTGGLLVKLILLPALAVVAIALTIVWLGRPAGDVNSLIDTLAREGRDRWSAALGLSAALHEPGGAALKRDPAVARRLSEILQKEINAGGMEWDQVRLRMYLCRALGEFQVADPLPVLVEAARLQRSGKEVEVRCSAIEALALLASHIGPAELRSDPPLVTVLLQAAEDEERRVRQRAAFALGVVGGEQAQARLQRMLADPSAEVRYNAATGLARHGNPKCIGILREMLQPQQVDARRTTVQRNALEATGRLAAANPSAELGELLEAVEQLAHAPVGAEVRVKAAEVLHVLSRRKGTAGGS